MLNWIIAAVAAAATLLPTAQTPIIKPHVVVEAPQPPGTVEPAPVPITVDPKEIHER